MIYINSRRRQVLRRHAALWSDVFDLYERHGFGCCLLRVVTAPEYSLCVVNDQPVGNPKRKV
jgi:hypothetical protein